MGEIADELRAMADRASAIPTKDAGPAEREIAVRAKKFLDEALGAYECRVILYRKDR